MLKPDTKIQAEVKVNILSGPVSLAQTQAFRKLIQKLLEKAKQNEAAK